MRLFFSACLAALFLVAAPAQATGRQTAYGYAWADGAGRLRITPVSASLTERDGIPFHSLEAIPGARELKLAYGGADFRRLTAECDLKETEGRLAVDRKGLGKTRCTPKDLARRLAFGPAPVRVVHDGTKAVQVREFLPAKYYTRTLRGTIRRVDGDTIAVKGVELTHTWRLTFNRVTATCGAGWLTGKPVNADDDGLGTKGCTSEDFARVLRQVEHPVLAVVTYNPFSRELLSVWEVFGDA